jgi:DNA-binding CsgD family transcriptional regulator
MYIHPFYISEILKSKYDNYNRYLESLTTREFEILNRILTDNSNLEIAIYFKISIRTVNAHKRNIMKKFNANNMEYVVSIVCQYSHLYQ